MGMCEGVEGGGERFEASSRAGGRECLAAGRVGTSTKVRCVEPNCFQTLPSLTRLTEFSKFYYKIEREMSALSFWCNNVYFI